MQILLRPLIGGSMFPIGIVPPIAYAELKLGIIYLINTPNFEARGKTKYKLFRPLKYTRKWYVYLWLFLILFTRLRFVLEI